MASYDLLDLLTGDDDLGSWEAVAMDTASVTIDLSPPSAEAMAVDADATGTAAGTAAVDDTIMGYLAEGDPWWNGLDPWADPNRPPPTRQGRAGGAGATPLGFSFSSPKSQ